MPIPSRMGNVRCIPEGITVAICPHGNIDHTVPYTWGGGCQIFDTPQCQIFDTPCWPRTTVLFSIA